VLATVKENAEALALTDEQKEKLAGLEKKYGEAPTDFSAKMHEIRTSDKSDEEKRAAMQELQKVREQNQVKDRECLAEVNKMLNADQQKKLAELLSKVQVDRRGGREGRTNPGGATGERPRRERPAGAGNTGGDDNAPKPDGIIE
jgi:Spy/CpxP family protein refolding chaperone